MSKSNNSKPIKNPSELSSSPPLIPSRIIDHVSVLPDDFDKDQFVQVIDCFISKAKYVIRKFDENESLIARSDLETQDLLHEMHLLPAANVAGGYKYYRRMREVQLARRQAKHENTLMKPLRQYLNQKPGLISELKQLQSALENAELTVDSYKYTYRLQDEG